MTGEVETRFGTSCDDVGVLVVEFLGDRRVLDPGTDLHFGRSAELVIDENPFMHRVVGRFVHREGVWWLQNVGRTIRLEVRDLDLGSVLEAAPGQQVPVSSRSFAVRFAAGPTTYELLGHAPVPLVVVGEEDEPTGTATIEFGAIPLSSEQHLLLVALYESRLRTGAIEGNGAIAARLGWTTPKFNRKLDAVCAKLDRAGVRGLKGGGGSGLAEARRDVLVNHAVREAMVGPRDLDLLRAATANRIA
jgi:hypothetical protein